MIPQSQTAGEAFLFGCVVAMTTQLCDPHDVSMTHHTSQWMGCRVKASRSVSVRSPCDNIPSRLDDRLVGAWPAEHLSAESDSVRWTS